LLPRHRSSQLFCCDLIEASAATLSKSTRRAVLRSLSAATSLKQSRPRPRRNANRRVLRSFFCCDLIEAKFLESVREDQLGLHSFRSMRRMEASLRKASALRLRHSQSLASLRQRPSQAKVRSTIQRLGRTTKRWG